jgi:hypothetical protein
LAKVEMSVAFCLAESRASGVDTASASEGDTASEVECEAVVGATGKRLRTGPQTEGPEGPEYPK